MRKHFKVALLTFVLFQTALPLQAQEEAPAQNRKWLLAGAGLALLGGSAAMLPDGHEGSFCATKVCLVPMGAIVGGFIGFMLGSDLDDKARATWNPAAHLTWASTATRMPGVPHRLASGGRDGASLVLTDRGLHYVTEAGVSELLRGTRVLDAALLRNGNQLAAATGIGALRLPLRELLVDTVLLGATSAVAASADGGMIAGQRGRLQRVAPGGSSAVAEATALGVPLAMTVDERGTLWVLWGSRLEARSAEGLELIGALQLDPAGRSMRLNGNSLALVDPSGVLLVDVSTPQTPRAGERLAVPNAQGVALTPERIYVAAGARGLFVFDRAGSEPTIVGIIRDLGFVADVQVTDGIVSALDRAGQRLLTGRADSIVPR